MRLFFAIQVLFLLFTYSFIYTSFIGTMLIIENYNISKLVLLPTIFSIFFYPYILYLCRKLFIKSNRLSISIWWMMGSSFTLILSLAMYLDSLVK